MKGRQIVFRAKGQAGLREFDLPQPEVGQIIIANDYTIVSAGTERANLVQLPNTVTAERGFPHFPGYSGAGTVYAVGEGIDNYQVGDRVVVKWGGHRSHSLTTAENLLKISDYSIDLLDAALAPIAAFSLLGVRKLKIELGESAMVVGLGILGALALQFAMLSGAIPVLGSDPEVERRQLALDLGAGQVFAPDEDYVNDRIKAATGGAGPKVIVEVTGSAAALQQALEYIAWEGRIALLGCTRISDQPIDFYKYVHKRGISIVGAHTFTRVRHESAFGRWTERDDCRTFLKLAEAGRLQTRPMISEVVSPEQGPEVYSELASGRWFPLGVAFDWSRLR